METFKLIAKTQRALEKEKITWPIMTNTLTEITVYAISRPNVKGETKSIQDYIMALFDSLDAQYHLVDKLDKLIDFKKIFGSVIGTVIEKVDSAMIRALVKYVIIPVIISFISPKLMEDNNG